MGLNSILIKILEVSILMASVLLVVTRFTMNLDPDSEDDTTLIGFAYFSLFFTVLGAFTSGIFLGVRILFGASLVNKIGVFLVFLPLSLGLLFLTGSVMSFVTDYKSALGLDDFGSD